MFSKEKTNRAMLLHLDGDDDSSGHATDDEEDRVEIGESESKAVNRVRILLILLLLSVAAAVSAAVYLYSQNKEIADFEIQFSVHAEKVIDSIMTTTARSLRAIEGFALQITIHAIDHNQTWPNVALSDFETRARITIDLAEAISLTFLPIVTNLTKPGYENFSVQNQEWLIHGLNAQKHVTEDDQESINQLIHTYGDPEQQRLHPSAVLPEVEGQIFKLDNQGIKTPEDGAGPSFVPWWQFAPAFPVSQIVNYNTLSNPSQRDGIVALMETEVTIVGRAFDYADVENDIGTSVRSAILNLFLNRRRAGANYYTGGPVSDLYSPIFNNFSDNRTLVGLLNSYVYWQVYFENVLPDNVNGLVAVIENSCNQTFTFQLNGADAVYLGEGDLHDKRYNHLEVSTGFGGVFLQDVNDDHTGQCLVNIRIYPSEYMESDYRTHTPFIFALVLIATFLFTSFVFFWYQHLVDMRQSVVMKQAIRSTAVVQSLFPAAVRDRIFEENEAQQQQQEPSAYASSRNFMRRDSLFHIPNNDVQGDNNKSSTVLTSEAIFGSKPIAELFPNTTVLFADMVGFTAWASVREPTQVFVLLETVYHAYDTIAKRRRVFKVETIGDCYVAAAGIPSPRTDHAVVMAKFAVECVDKMKELTNALEVSLGPDTADLGMRIGVHSGPVTAGVLRGHKGRFQLFGDTVNTAARMESTGVCGKIHITLDTADLLIGAGKAHWIAPREEKIAAKGKGELQTYWIEYRPEESQHRTDSISGTDEIKGQGKDEDSLPITRTSLRKSRKGKPSMSKEEFLDILNEGGDVADAISKSQSKLSSTEDDEIDQKTMRLVQWNIDVLQRLLKQILARRAVRRSSNRSLQKSESFRATSLSIDAGQTVLDEVKDIIALPKFNADAYKNVMDFDSIEFPSEVTEQLNSFVTNIALMYRSNPFHNFEHASHVTMSVTKLLSRIVNPVEVASRRSSSNDEQVAADLHDHTFGITSDPLTQFACVFSALIHDVDHPGVSNMTLVNEQHSMAKKYKNKSVAEQNSVDLAWDLLMNGSYNDLCGCIYAKEHELRRFRQLVVNVVMATDIIDRDLGALRKARWEKAFRDDDEDSTLLSHGGSVQEDINRKATIVIEHLIQASDVAHTMQHWHVYRKWNERLFDEMYQAYKEGRVGDKDPSISWYQGEIGFFDFYIIPLAKKLETCGVFGVSSHEYLNYALANRQEWEDKGKQIVQDYLEKWSSPPQTK